MSTLDTVKKDVTTYGLPAIEAIDLALTLIGVGGPEAEVLKVVEAVLKTFAAGATTGTDAASILAELDKLWPGVADDDQAADKAVDAKFGTPK